MIRTVGELKAYLELEGISPERLAERVKISNMTLRRLLAKPARTAIPEKYQVHFNALGAKAPVTLAPAGIQKDFKELISELAASGESVGDVTKLKKDVKKKLGAAKLGAEFVGQISILFQRMNAGGSLRDRALCAGALLYFLNPFDAIPDALPGIGYLDDFAVITLVLGIVARSVLKEDSAENCLL